MDSQLSQPDKNRTTTAHEVLRSSQQVVGKNGSDRICGQELGQLAVTSHSQTEANMIACGIHPVIPLRYVGAIACDRLDGFKAKL